MTKLIMGKSFKSLIIKEKNLILDHFIAQKYHQ